MKKTTLLFWVLVLSLPLLSLSACGKKELPRPDYSTQEFSWRNVFADITDTGCLAINGSATGSVRNVDKLVLELQALDSSCEGCPFVAQEHYTLDANNAWENSGTDLFRFAYCPAGKADAYRWRLVGKNSNKGLSDVFTPVRVVSSALEIPEE